MRSIHLFYIASVKSNIKYHCSICCCYQMYEKRDRRVKYKTSEKIRQNNPNRVNYDRILELRNRSNLKGRNWSDPGEYEYEQGGRHNGDFGPPRRW